MRSKANYFPRWNALGKLSSLDGKKKTSALMVAGDSKRENKIGVANGFPKNDLFAGEVIVLQDALDVLGLNAGDKINI